MPSLSRPRARGAIRTDVDAIEGVRASGPLHERRRRRRPSVLHVGERAITSAQHEVQGRLRATQNVRSELIDRRTRYWRCHRRRVPVAGLAVIADVDAVEGPIRRHRRESVRVAPADGRALKPAVGHRIYCRRVLGRAAWALARRSLTAPMSSAAPSAQASTRRCRPQRRAPRSAALRGPGAHV